MNNDWSKQFDEKFAMEKKYFDGKFISHATYTKDIKDSIQTLLDKQKQEERENGEFMVIAYDYEVGNTVQISIVLDSYQEALSFKESEYQKKENPNARVVKILEELKN